MPWGLTRGAGPARVGQPADHLEAPAASERPETPAGAAGIAHPIAEPPERAGTAYTAQVASRASDGMVTE